MIRKIKTGYAYLFYFLYNSVNKKDNILVQWKSIFIILVLELVVVGSCFCYSIDIYKFDIPQKPNLLFMLAIIVPLVALKLWFFEYNRKWESYLQEFNKWPDKKQKKWNVVMRLIIILVFANLIISFYWMSQIDWKQYR